MRLSRSALLLASLALAAAAVPSLAKTPPPPDHWVGTWAAAPMASQNKLNLGSTGQTLREIVHVSLGGPLVRVVLTNEFGTEPLHIGEAHIANSAGAGSISLFSANALTFGGHPDVTIPAGALVVSDPVALTLKPLSDVAVSLFIPAQTISTLSQHEFADQTSYIADGNQVSKGTLTAAHPLTSWPILKGIDARLPGKSNSIVCFGDSITDGARSTEGANQRWPDLLAKRLHDSHRTDDLAVLNEGIGGNRVLYPGTGPAALARFDRDVIAQAGVRYVIFLEAINDIGRAYGPQAATSQPQQPATAADLITAYKQMIERAHIHGIRVIGATLTPYMGAGYSSPAGDAVRKEVNDWIRTSKDLDGVIDFEKATADPGNPDLLNPAADSGDHLHPKDAGYRMMADSIDLGLFLPKKKQEPVKAKLPAAPRELPPAQ